MNKNSLISASIFFKGDQLDPDHVSQTLGLRPNDSQKKGDKVGGIPPNSRTYTKKTGTWRVRIESESRTASELIGDVLQMFDKRQEPLDKIAGVAEAYIDISVVQDQADKLDSTAEFIISKDQILRAGELGLAVWITVS